MYEESTYIGKLRQIKIQIFWTGNTAILTVWCFLITDWMQFTLSYTLHVSDKIGDAILHGISIKVKDTELD
jgi:hypothetical protein